MSTTKRTKLNHLLAIIPKGAIILSSWLKSQGYSFELIKRYKHSGWLESIGTGALIRAGDKVNYYGALYALQSQKNSNIHIGGRSAFSILGKAHYLELNSKKLILLGSKNNKLPTWFTEHDWKISIEYHVSDFLPPKLGLVEIDIKDLKVQVSDATRALMECLHIAPKHQELSECYEFMESINNVHPKKVQELLENCNSVKVKRLFLYLAEKNKHAWFKYLDITKINLGSGKRSIIKKGFLDKKYQITLPKQWGEINDR